MDTADEPTEPSRTSGSGWTLWVVAALTAALAAMTAALIVTMPGSLVHPSRAGPWWSAVIIAFAFGLAERHVFHIEYRQESVSFSLSEVPTVFALVFLGPIVAIVVRMIGSLAVLLLRPHPIAHKVLFNAALFSFELALAYAIVRRILDTMQFDEGRFLVAAAVGVTAASLIGPLAVSLVVSSHEGDAWAHLLNEIRTSVVTGPVSAAIAVVSVAPAMFGLGYVVFSVVPAVAVWVVLMQLGRLRQRLRDLEALHGFTRVVGGSLDLDEIAAIALTEVAGVLRASSGFLQVYDEGGAVLRTATTGSTAIAAPTGRDDPRWQAVSVARTAIGFRLDADGVVRIDPRDRCDRIAVPVRDDHGELALLVIGGRLGRTDQFTNHDVVRINTIAEQLAASLRTTRLHAAMERIALHDTLTGHSNRAGFEHLVDDELADPRPPGLSAAVLVLDLDQFKEVNDTLGHHVGDQALVEFARRVSKVLAPGDLLARFGGDEFALFVARPDPGLVRDLADRILTESHAPLELDGFGIVVTVSIGIAMVSDDDSNAAAVLRRADIAMHAAKTHHVGSEIYREEIDRRTPERLSLLGDLREALDHGRIDVHYQPKIDLATSTVIGVEALARWHHPTRGWVPPDDFIAVAEETGLIRQLTDHVLTTAIRDTRSWLDGGYDIGCAVNVSTLDLLDELLAERVAHRLRQHHLAPGKLTLEITESSLMSDTPRTMATVDRLRQIGIGLSLDDFGTGYSSLSYLRRLPVNELKIDRSFVANMLLEPQDEVIVRSTIDLGHNLGLLVVAEGIENRPVEDRLRSLGCDTGQGYGISRPLSIELLGKWLTTTHHRIPLCTETVPATALHPSTTN